MTGRLSHRVLALTTMLLLVLCAAWTHNCTRHFIGHHDWDTVNWVTAAQNYQRYGLLDTRLQQIHNPTAAPRADWDINLHHPPGISLITYGALRLLGGSELALRLPPIAASLLAAALLFRLARSLYGVQIAGLATFFWGGTPLMRYYSGKIGHEQFLLPLMLLALILYRRSDRRSRLILCLLAATGGLIGWAWFLFLGLLALHARLCRPVRPVKSLWPLWAGGAVGLIGLIGLFAWQQPGFIRELWDAMTLRAANRGGSPISFSAWLDAALQAVIKLPTVFVILFGLGGLWLADWNRDRWLLVVLALTGVLYALIFWQAFYSHDYLVYYTVPPLCTWASLACYRLLYAAGSPPRLPWRMLVGFLLLLFVIASQIGTRRLWTIDTYDQRYEWGMLARQATAPDEVIVTNLDELWPTVGYYARRALKTGYSPAMVIEAGQPAHAGFYIYCVEPDSAPPAWLADETATYDEAAACYLIDLDP